MSKNNGKTQHFPTEAQALDNNILLMIGVEILFMQTDDTVFCSLKQPKQKIPRAFKVAVGGSKSVGKSILHPGRAESAVLISLQLLRGAVEGLFLTSFESPMVTLHVGSEKFLGIFCFGCFRLQSAVKCKCSMKRDMLSYCV